MGSNLLFKESVYMCPISNVKFKRNLKNTDTLIGRKEEPGVGRSGSPSIVNFPPPPPSLGTFKGKLKAPDFRL